MAWFFAALPLSQLVPTFVWLESFHVKGVDDALRRVGLEPTNAAGTAAGGDTDELWAFVRQKFSSHAGFIAEAVMEALPQAVLQVGFAARAGRVSLLNGLSIALSLVVLSSKG